MVNFGEVWGGGAVSQIHSPHLHWCPWDLFRSFKVCSDAKERVGCGKQWEATTPIQSLVKLQPWFLSLQWKTCLRQNCSLGSCVYSERPALVQNTLMTLMMIPQFNNLFELMDADNGHVIGRSALQSTSS